MSQAKRSFDHIESTRSGCRKCGRAPTQGTVNVMLRRRNAKGSSGAGPYVAGRTMSFCEPCAVEVFEDMVAVFPGDS